MWRIKHQDIAASWIIFLLGLPLAIGTSFICKAPISSGILAAIVGGLLVGCLGKIPLQVAGPAASITIFLYQHTYPYHFKAIFYITFLAGLLQIAFSFLPLSRLLKYLPQAVIEGMVTGIGVQIIISQWHTFTNRSTYATTWLNIVHFIPQGLPAEGRQALLLGLITVASCLLWQRLPKANVWLPSSMLGVGMAATIAHVAAWPVRFVVLPEDLWHVPGNFFQSMPFKNALWAAFSLALIATIYTILCSKSMSEVAVNKPGYLKQEILAHGIGNTLLGLLGGLPIVAVLARSKANQAAGALSRYATLLHGFWMLLAVLFAKPLLNSIPLSCLAALFMIEATKLLHFRYLGGQDEEALFALWQKRLAFFTTFIIMLTIDLMAGVLGGIVVYYLLQAGRYFSQQNNKPCLLNRFCAGVAKIVLSIRMP